ncbi:hypothetical protein AVEN_210616-1 [Araneus ventricosus]|uniref:Uncharacterized protein n=1 Tax=Araneus ventricosus TaxID=182803 RepID=A0A4Y2HXC8_ARAVE|nr:hypothetical protein AVEN_210616-1 [Araneus ventricosus]
MDSSFDPGSMLSLPDRALVVKLFYKNGESTTIALRKLRTEKGPEAQKSLISLNGILSLIRRFKKNGEFGGSSTKWQTILERGPRPCCRKCHGRHLRGVAVLVKLGE